jgi:hypothetical protein
METSNIAVLFESLHCYMKTKTAMIANNARTFWEFELLLQICFEFPIPNLNI